MTLRRNKKTEVLISRDIGRKNKEIRLALFWVVTQRMFVLVYWRFGLVYQSHLQGQYGVKMGLIGCHETSVNNYQSTLHNIREERRFQLHHGADRERERQIYVGWTGFVLSAWQLAAHELGRPLTKLNCKTNQSAVVQNTRTVMMHGLEKPDPQEHRCENIPSNRFNMSLKSPNSKTQRGS
jgi:hypothetical protein